MAMNDHHSRHQRSGFAEKLVTDPAQVAWLLFFQRHAWSNENVATLDNDILKTRKERSVRRRNYILEHCSQFIIISRLIGLSRYAIAQDRLRAADPIEESERTPIPAQGFEKYLLMVAEQKARFGTFCLHCHQMIDNLR